MDGSKPIRATVTVRSDPARAFELFTAQMGKWWPLESYSRAVNEFEHEDVGVSELMFEARMGGSILERMTDGRVLPWADVLAWQPPQRFVLSWLTALLTRTAHRARGDFCCARRRHVDRGRASRMGAVVGGVPHGLYELYERGWPFTLECFVAETTETADGHRQGHSVSLPTRAEGGISLSWVIPR